MRRAIDTAPRDGKLVILEDDASGSFELARWSAEARAWVRENGELSKIAPTHWHTTRREFDAIALRQVAKPDPVTVARLEARAALEKSEHGPPARRRFAVSSIAAALVAASLIGLYFRAELATYVKRSAGEHDAAGIGTVGAPVARAEALANELTRAQQVIETQVALASKTRDQAAQLSQAAESATAELRQSLQKEHDRAEALAGELATARRDLETQLALASKAGDQAAQVNKAAENATAELRLSLQKEHDRAEALTSELARAQRDLETQVALASKAGDEAAQLKQLKEAAESATAELRQSLQKEHDRAEALASELTRAQRDTVTQAVVSSQKSDQAAQLQHAAEDA